MINSVNERRNTLRVQLRTYGNLAAAGRTCLAHLLNLSETGALVAIIEPHQLRTGQEMTLDIDLPDNSRVSMKGRIAHLQGHMVGLDCVPATKADAARVAAIVSELALQA